MAYDSEATKQRILAAAVREFADRGIAGARIDRIATNANANKQAIYAYFGNKDALFRRVIVHVMSELAEEIPPTPDDLGDYAARLFDYHRAHPDFLRLMLWEALEYGDQNVPAEPARLAQAAEKTRIVAEGQQDGRVSRDFDPGALMLFVIALVDWLAVVPQPRRLYASNLSDDELRAQIARAVTRMTSADGDPAGDHK